MIENIPENIPSNINKRSFFMPVAIIAFVILAIFSIYFEAKQSSLNSEFNALMAKKKDLTLSQEPTSEKDAVTAAAAVKNALQDIEQKELQWSKIIGKLEELVPKNKDKNEPIVLLKSYNGTEEGRISLNGITRAGALEPFKDVAALIRTFISETTFKNVFVPSITKSLTPEGTTVLTFSLNLNYQKQSF